MSKKNYYELLEINSTATTEEIKTAFRKLSLIHHPDRQGGDIEKFKLINEAYECLSDKNLRHDYDHPNQAQHAHRQGFPDIFQDFFAQQFGNFQHQRQVKRNDHIFQLKIQLNDVHFGITKKLKINVEKNCFICKTECSTCKGTGIIQQIIQMGPMRTISQNTCNNCGSLGTINKVNPNCSNCGGTSKIKNEKIIEIVISKNIENNTNQKFEGLGEQTQKENEIPGDLIVNIQIEKHPHFDREQQHLVYKCELNLTQVFLGKNILVPHFDGDIPINTNIFGIPDHTKRYHLKNRGINGKGDLIFVFSTRYPDKTLSDTERSILENAFNAVGL